MKPEFEWHKAVDFAEVAEAIGIPTTQVAAIHFADDNVIVAIYTAEPGDHDDHTVWTVMLRRDADGILIPGPPTARGTIGDMHAEIERGLGQGPGV